MAHCWDCGEAFGPGNKRITAVKTLGINADPDYLHENCWNTRKNNRGRPPRLPEGPLTWHTSVASPVTTGPVPTTEHGVVILSVQGEPAVRIDLRTGAIGIRPATGPREDGDPITVTGWHEITGAFDPSTPALLSMLVPLRVVPNDAEIIHLPGLGADRDGEGEGWPGHG